MNRSRIYQILFLVLSVVFIYILFTHFGEFKSALVTLSGGVWYFLLAALMLQVIGIVNKGALFHALYDYFSVKDTLKKFIKIALASNFLNLVAPTAGFSGMALFVSEAKDQSVTKSKVIIINLVYYFLVYGFFLFVLLFGLFYLFFNQQLQNYQLVTAGILFGIISAMLVFLIISIRGIVRFKKLIGFLATVVNFVPKILVRRKIIEESQIRFLANETSELSRMVVGKWRGLMLPILHVALMEIIDILTLYYLFLAFGYYVYPGILITAYAVGFLFQLVSITPSGIGVVEATMIVVLTGMKVPVEIATIVVLGYRFITFWLPFFAGFEAFRMLKNGKSVPRAAT